MKTMKMMKSCLMLTALCAVLCFSSCSDDDDPVLAIPEGTSSSISLDCNNAIMSLPIQASGDWTVSVVGNDEVDWIYIGSVKGKGDGTLNISVDYNETGANRTAIVRFSDGERVVDYNIVQGIYNEKDDGANGEGDKKYNNLGIGWAVINVPGRAKGSSYENMFSKQIFNFFDMNNDALKGDKQLQTNFVSENDIHGTELELSSFASLDTTSTVLTADLSVKVSYGMFKLGLSGDFGMYGAEKDTVHTYAATGTIPRSKVRLSYDYLVDHYATLNEKNKDMRMHLFTSTFLNCHDSIDHYISLGQTREDKELKKHLDKLDKKFGPVFASSLAVGGMVNIDFGLKTIDKADSLRIGGKLTTGFTNMFSLDVQASATYVAKNWSFVSGSTLTVAVYGGSTDTHSALIGALCNITKADEKNPFDPEKVTAAIGTWVGSVDSSNGEVIEISGEGIWNLFSGDAADEVEEYFKEKYPNSESGECPYLFDVQNLW